MLGSWREEQVLMGEKWQMFLSSWPLASHQGCRHWVQLWKEAQPPSSVSEWSSVPWDLG